MFFIISKLLSFLLKPLTWIIICFILAVLWRNIKIKERFLKAGLFLFIFFTNPWITNEVMKRWEVGPILISSLKTYDLAIILTGVTKDDYPRDRVHYMKGADRVLHPIQLFKSGKIKKILITGGSGLVINENRDVESEKLKQTMLLAGIPDSVITIENKSKNTHENAVNSKKIIDKKFPDSEYLLVTSAFHMRRASGCFAKAGIVATPFPVDFYAEYDGLMFDAIIPSVEALQAWHILFKEWFGIIVYKLMGYI